MRGTRNCLQVSYKSATKTEGVAFICVLFSFELLLKHNMFGNYADVYILKNGVDDIISFSCTYLASFFL